MEMMLEGPLVPVHVILFGKPREMRERERERVILLYGSSYIQHTAGYSSPSCQLL